MITQAQTKTNLSFYPVEGYAYRYPGTGTCTGIGYAYKRTGILRCPPGAETETVRDATGAHGYVILNKNFGISDDRISVTYRYAYPVCILGYAYQGAGNC